MNVLVLTSNREDIDSYYLSVTKSICSYLANHDCDLIWSNFQGFDDKSLSTMSGITYNEFTKNGRNIYTFTTDKYKNEMVNLPNMKTYVRESTFELRKMMFENSDLIVALPGSVETQFELNNYIVEKMNNDKDVPIVIYNEDGSYNTFFNYVNDLYKERLDINMLNLVSNKDEFSFAIENIISKERGIRNGK